MNTDAQDVSYPIPFERKFFDAGEPFMRIGSGACGGKASGLLEAHGILRSHPFPALPDGSSIDIPTSVVLATDVFERFMSRNDLLEIALSGASDERIAHAFQRADFPTEFVGDLLGLIEATAGRPLAVRSSSLLEDALAHPFAGIYRTKMIPNNQPDPRVRFQRLLDAVKFVYASTYFRDADEYRQAIEADPADERMAVLIQEVVGQRRNGRFYPDVSGVSRSFSYYRTGSARPEEGVVSLALGLGKTIVDGGVSWSYSPAYPQSRGSFASVDDLLKHTQLKFWAVNLGKPPAYDPTRETEYLVHTDLRSAEYDGTLRHTASTYDAMRERLMSGVAVDGPRVLDFAPLLQFEAWPLNDAVAHFMAIFEEHMGHPVEVEFALTFASKSARQARLAVLQVRPMRLSRFLIQKAQLETEGSRLLLYSDQVMGNGVVEGLRDIVYVKPEAFERGLTVQIAGEVERINRSLREAGRKYLLIGFGRWGSSERWLGIPVTWGQISSAAAIVESTLPEIDVDPSQGSHFFHNIEAFQVCYFCITHDQTPPLDWNWLSEQRLIEETETVRHVETQEPITVKVDGSTGRGAVWHD